MAHNDVLGNNQVLLDEIEQLKEIINSKNNEVDVWKKEVTDLKDENENLREMKDMFEKNYEELLEKDGDKTILGLTSNYEARINELTQENEDLRKDKNELNLK